ncbi:unnamed protein product [Cyprideis torosa]|uniref:Uncharacterized protein n=1 Tax=Cyprideis torosa TaxID=163714 RepID=A0A7R8W0M2_9CRUS|nr:unnamed protein product [Cyprideis torosa]CAG0878797.1 unnamed protein product [Cyprideis torosa]
MQLTLEQRSNPMYAVIKTGGKQYRVAEGDKLRVETLNAAQGDSIELDSVLMVGEGDDVKIGTPVVANASVTATVVTHARADKADIFSVIACKIEELSMAHKKAGGSTRNGRDSEAKRLGVKKYGGEAVIPGNIIVRQRGTKIHAGTNVGCGKDHTLFAKAEGVIKFENKGPKNRNIYLQASKDLNTLADFRHVRTYTAERGQNGMSRNCTGKKGDDLIIAVPIGTVARDIETDEIIADLTADGERALIARGGFHGLGNTRFKSSVNRAPRQTSHGTEGERRDLQLELRVLADVGLLGFPNAGKSTFIRAVSSARPKVADYPFTTLHPNLGVVSIEQHRSFVIADIPGLVEGASAGHGLGIRFLKHLARTRLLLHIIDVAPVDGSDPASKAKNLIMELESYSPELAERERWIVLNKLDLLTEDERKTRCKKIITTLNWTGPVFEISAISRQGTRTVGSSLVTADGAGLDLNATHAWAEQIVKLKHNGCEVVLVSSGSISEGMSRLGWKKRPSAVHQLQAAAAVGQMGLIQAYESSFKQHGEQTAQILLTHEDLANRERYLNARSTLQTLLSLNVTPIINENDTVTTDEIKFGDNDTLSALVANLIDADTLIILTDQHGLFSEDPRKNPNAQLIERATAGDPEILTMAGPSGTLIGSGGMRTKLIAAERAARSGTTTIIASGREENVLLRLKDGESIGTMLTSAKAPLLARKQWLANQLKARGRLILDDGACNVLRNNGSSLLAVGVTSVEGTFRRGEMVTCHDAHLKEIARGLSNYSSEEISKLKGHPSNQIEAILGYRDEPELINRDNMVVQPG